MGGEANENESYSFFAGLRHGGEVEEEEFPDGRSDDPEEAHLHDLAVSTLHMELENTGLIRPAIEEDSIYGAAIVMPQIARCAGWTPATTVMSIRMCGLYLLSCFLQLLLLYMVN